MSLLSRNTGGGRRSVAKMAAVFAGTLLTYLVVTAVPAFAQTTCTATTITAANDHVTLNVGTDDAVVLDADTVAGEIGVSINGGAIATCPGDPIDAATTDWLEIVGSNAGNETVTIYDTEDVFWDNFTTTFNGGNGTDTLIFSNAAIAAPPLPDQGSFFIGMRQSGAAIAVDISGTGTSAEVRVDNAEAVTVNGSVGDDGLCASRTVAFGACDVDLLTQSTNIAATAGDDFVLPASAPVTQGLTLNGGAGNDVLASGNGNDSFLGAAGSDAVSYEASAAAVTVDLAAATGTGMGADTLSDVQDVWGSTNDDTLLGNSLDNNIFGDAGDDTIDGREGNDGATPGAFAPGVVGLGLLGGLDDDDLTDGAGNDIVNGNEDDDVVHQGAAPNGADALSGPGDGDCDTIDYGARTGAVTINESTGTGWGEALEGDTGAGFEFLVTGSGNDTLIGNGSSEIFVPGAGDDTVEGNGQGAGLSPCGLGDLDYLDLSAAAGDVTFDLVNGTATGEGNDTFSEMEGYLSGGGNDTLLLGDSIGNDNTLGNWSSDGGIDTVDASAATTNQVINLRVFGFDCSPDTQVGCLEVENATGGSGNDAITGNGLANTLIGGDGADSISGLNGNDTVEGGLGNDSLSGGNGADTLLYIHASSGEDIDTQLGFASGGDGEDAIQFFEIVKGSDFADSINAGQTAFDLNNRIFGRGGEDNITGSNSADLLVGGGADDTIRAGKGDDTIKGNAGNDLLVGGGGFDIGFGGKGNDTCKKVEQKHSC